MSGQLFISCVHIIDFGPVILDTKFHANEMYRTVKLVAAHAFV